MRNAYQRTIFQLLAPLVGNANPVLIFQTRVYGFDRIQTRVPGYPGLTYDGSLVSGRLANRSL